MSNREVKPCLADDTATPSGKVGRRQIRQRASQECEALFFLSIALGVIAFKLVSLQLQTQLSEEE